MTNFILGIAVGFAAAVLIVCWMVQIISKDLNNE